MLTNLNNPQLVINTYAYFKSNTQNTIHCKNLIKREEGKITYLPFLVNNKFFTWQDKFLTFQQSPSKALNSL